MHIFIKNFNFRFRASLTDYQLNLNMPNTKNNIPNMWVDDH